MALRQNVVLPSTAPSTAERTGNLNLAVTLAFLVRHEVAGYTIVSAEVQIVKRPQELVAVMPKSPELKVSAWSRKGFACIDQKCASALPYIGVRQRASNTHPWGTPQAVRPVAYSQCA